MNVGLYSNNRMNLYLKNKKQNKEITIDIPDLAIGSDLVMIDPNMADNGIIRLLKKNRIIRSVVSTINYNYLTIPLVKMNMGKLKEYDLVGTRNYQETISQLGGE